MSSFFSSLGRMIIFALILPGVVGFMFCVFLFQNKSSELLYFKNYAFIQYVVVLGFIANTVGHISDELIHRKRRNESKYQKIINLLRNQVENSNVEIFVIRKIEYLESLSAFYWNSAIILLLLIYRLLALLAFEYKTGLIVLIAIICIGALFTLSELIVHNADNFIKDVKKPNN